MNRRTAKSAKGRIVVGMSGGVDSSVAAWLLKQQGYEVVGLFMKNWEDDDDSEYCSTRQDWLDAASVADLIGVEIEAVNFAAEYKDRVFAEFLREYEAGRTPNPDVLCNAEIKFKAFLDHALAMGAEQIATGHYARVREVGASGTRQYQLLKGVDASKDQSYFLHRLNQYQLARTLFPLGELPKTIVRRIAAELRLPNAAKKDSTGICFIGERPFREFLSRYLPSSPGAIVTPTGEPVGQHHGLSFYTLGQRKGLGIGGVKTSQKQDGQFDAWYVARKNLADNTLTVVQGHDHPWLLQTQLHAQNASWVAGSPPAEGTYSAKTRYRQPDMACQFSVSAKDTLHNLSDHAGAVDRDGMQGANRSHSRSYGEDLQRRRPPESAATAARTIVQSVLNAEEKAFTLNFDAPQWAITPGQSAVLYDGEVCLGGGIIG